LTGEDQRHELFSGQFDVLNLFREEKVIIIIALYETNKRKTINCKYPSCPKSVQGGKGHYNNCSV
jgi:hypothetical protein